MLKLLYAIRFMTVIPIPYRQDEDLKKIARSSRYFPLVGLLIGLLLYGLYYLLHLAELDLLAAVGVTLLWVLITGGLHLDGLADTADGIGGGQSIERRLEIMKDSRIGSFGALALISQILIKTALIYELPETIALPALLVSPMLGRTSCSSTSASSPRHGREGWVISSGRTGPGQNRSQGHCSALP